MVPVVIAGARVVACRRRLTAVTATARLTALVSTARTAVTVSFLYRWLTAEPEPEVIVIDLRETRTVGPVITVVDRSLRELTAGLPTSIIIDIASSVASFGRERPIRVASGVGLATVCTSLLIGTLTQTVSGPMVGFHLLLAVLAATGLRSTITLAELHDYRVVQVLVAAFEPPEPPAVSDQLATEERTETDDHNDVEASRSRNDETSRTTDRRLR